MACRCPRTLSRATDANPDFVIYLICEPSEEPWKRKYNFVPEKYSSLRKVPAFKNFIQERFERCLDLYLAPRARKQRLTIQPEDLVPQLPDPKDLQPFPQVNAQQKF